MARRRVRGMVAVVGGVVATLVAGAVTALPAVAATPPEITSVAVSSTAVTAPGQVTLSYTAKSSEPVTQALAAFKDPAGRFNYLTLTTGLSGSATQQLPDGVTNGTWTLQYLYVSTSAATFDYLCGTAYGSTNTKCTETRDLSAYDVVVSGSTEDFDAPVMTSLSVSPTAVRPGTPVTVRFAATDAHPITDISVRWKQQSTGATLSISSNDLTALAAGSVTKQIPRAVYNGDYALESVLLSDANGFQSTYRADGTVVYSSSIRPPYAHGTVPSPGRHSLPFAPYGLTMADSYYAGKGPVLTDLSVAGQPAVAGDTVRGSYSATLSDATLSGVSAQYALAGAPEVTTELTIGAGGATGQLTGMLPERVGAYRLQRVVLADTVGRTTQYLPDGRVLDRRGSVIGVHALDLARQDLTARPDAVGVTARSKPQAAELRVLARSDQVADLTGYRVTVSPGGRTVDVPVTGSSQKIGVTGLRNGTAYTFSVVPRSKVGDGPATKASATPAMSGNIWAAGDVNGDRRNDLFAKVPGAEIRLYRSAGYPKFKAPTTVLKPAETHNFPSGTISGQAAFLSVYSGYLYGNLVGDDGSLRGQTRTGSGWGSLRFIDGSADLTGDGKPDVVAVTSTGTLRIYRGDSNGRFTSPSTVGSGWGSMLRVFVPGDVTGDRRADVMAVDSTGVLWIYPGNGRAGFATKKRVGSGWSGMGAVFAARDLTGDGRADLGAVTMDGKLRLYPGRGNGSFGSPATIGSGWNTFF